MSRRTEPTRIIDKRFSGECGSEYQMSDTREWISSSASRWNNPQLVELYEWLHNSGYREGTTVFASTYRSNIAPHKSARKRPQSSASFSASTIWRTGNDTQMEAGPTVEGAEKTGNGASPIKLEEDLKQSESDLATDITEDRNSQDHKVKKPRLEDSYFEELSQLSLLSHENSEATSPTKTESQTPTTESLRAAFEETAVGLASSKAQNEDQLVKEFNRNTEQMIEVYFKEGMDASGVEMFDILLGPYRRPTKEFVASFFYAVILSPHTEPATIEAAIHVLDRTLTIHGPEPFQDIWDVQKRRRELADGKSSFSRLSALSSSTSTSTSEGPGLGSGLGSGRSTRSSANTSVAASTDGHGGDDGGEGFPSKMKVVPIPVGRLPSWNNVWDLIKAEFGLDSKPESRQHIALQEHLIRMALQGDMGYHDANEEGEGEKNSGTTVRKEEQEIRDEVGRAIVGLLIRVLEQDAVLKNVSMRTFFCRNVLTIDPYSPGQTVRQALDFVFQIITLATSSRYLEPPSSSVAATPSLSSTRQEFTAGLSINTRATASWPVNDRCTLNSAGLEILQLGQQFLLLLIRFTEAGVLLPNKGLEELSREVLSRLSKVNKDRKLPGSSSSSSSGRTAGPGSGTIPFFLERYSLDQTEIFLKTLIQGSCLLDSGTGSGAGVKLRKERQNAQSLLSLSSLGDLDDGNAGDDSFAFEEEDYNGIFKSQTGICMGSSAFVMVLVDHWFKSKTTSGTSGGGSSGPQWNFRRVVEEYAMPNHVRSASTPATPLTASTAATGAKLRKKRTTKTKTSGRRRKDFISEDEQEADEEDEGQDEALGIRLKNVELISTVVDITPVDDPEGVEQWNAKDLEQVEWTVMMIEVLVWSWIEARGIRREEIVGTGLEQALFPQDVTHSVNEETSGWLAMSKLLETIGGTLKSRWDVLEMTIEAAVFIEDVGLR